MYILQIFVGKKPLTKEEKLRLFSDPDIWHNSRTYMQTCNGPLTMQGMRKLSSYGFTNGDFHDTVDRIRTNTKKDRINMLDIGGASVIALKDAKELSDKVITHNLTIDVEPAQYPVDFLHLCPAERMPAELKEDMDLIVSQTAFRYFCGPGLALENCLQALSIGGEARLAVSTCAAESFVEDVVRRLIDQYARLKRLSEQGYIELDVGDSKIYEAGPDIGEYEVPYAFVQMRKLKSVPDN